MSERDEVEPACGFSWRGLHRSSHLRRLPACSACAAVLACAPLAVGLSVAAAHSAWPPAEWQAAAKKLSMTVLAPKETGSLRLRGVSANILPRGTECLNAGYRTSGGASLSIVEARPQGACGNIGAEKAVRHVTIEGHRADVMACALPGCHTSPDALLWSEDGNEMTISWMRLATSKAVKLARSLAIVPRANAARSATSVIAHDEAVVASKYADCRAFSLTGCAFLVAHTADGKGQTLYAIDLERDAGDSCATGVTYFFRGKALLTSTPKLAPHAGVATPYSADHHPVVAAAGVARFAVRYMVNRSRLAICAEYGAGGSDTYVYRWTGSKMVKVSGSPPRPPKALAPGG